MIQVQQLCKSYRTNDVLSNLDIAFQHEGITAILGPNGSGKTTLLKCMLGMVLPDSGDIRINGSSILHKYNYRDQVCHVPQTPHFPENLTGHELIQMVRDLRSGVTRENDLIQLFNLKHELDKKMSRLSGGNLQKLNLLLGLLYDCPLIILDEPSTGLDPLSLQNLKAWLLQERDHGKLILFTTHIMSFVEDIADHIIFLLDGTIYFNGQLQELLRHEQEEKLERAIANILKPAL
ncbi:MAG: ABC transporter ATP-binding protein [Saprospiraceae bacterium]|nr:ABC transporter ATP-binding protein [Saprospiraceae bacterium]